MRAFITKKQSLSLYTQDVINVSQKLSYRFENT